MQTSAPDWIREVVAPHVSSIPPYVPGKPVAELAREMGIVDAVKMASNENPLGPSPKAIAAMADHLDQMHIYPESSGPALRDAIARAEGVSPDQVLLGNGSDEIMEMAAHVFIRPGDEAVMGLNAFSMYHICVEAFGGVPVRVPLKDYRYDLAACARAVNDRTRLVFIAAPNSPTGTMVSRAELEEFFAAMQRQKVIVLLDEAYREFVDDPDSPQGRDFIDRECPAVVLRTFSKIYGLAGLRVGYGLGPKWLIELLNRVRPPFNVNALAQIAATAALEDHEHKEKSKRLARDGIAYLTEELTKLGLRVAPSQANFVCFFLPCDAHDVYVSMLKKGVIVRKLDSFGLPDAIRVTVGLREHNERFVKALIGALDEHKISGVG